MVTDRSRVRGATPAAVVIVALVAAFVALAIVQPEVAIMLVIFGFVFGHDLLRELTAALRESNADATDGEATPDEEPADALERLRTRYADGELSDTEFERRLEVLLETETVADVERYLADANADPSRRADRDPADSNSHSRDRDPELERSSG